MWFVWYPVREAFSEGEETRSKQKELDGEQQLIRDEVREWWWELDFERQMLRKEADAKREELKTNKNSLKESKVIIGDC